MTSVSERPTSTQYKRIIHARALSCSAATRHAIKLVPHANGRVDLAVHCPPCRPVSRGVGPRFGCSSHPDQAPGDA
ncbi:MAG: hypothetical protein ACYDAN_09470 [Candidatus Limnocylindrales bacterium]